MRTLFETRDVVARWVPEADARRIVITFDSYTDVFTLDRPGFGEAYFQARGITAVHILSRINAWYQDPETPALLDAVREAVSGAERVLAYGSSMGGYAAIRLGRRAGAHAALAMSPQYSIDPRRVDFEPRWRAEARGTAFLPELEGPIEAPPLTVVAYDPRDPADSGHFERIAAEAAVQPLPAPYSAHSTIGQLSEAGLLEPLIDGALSGDVDTADFARRSFQARRQSSTYHSQLADRQPACRPFMAVRLARRALELRPDNPSAAFMLARKLEAAGQDDEAVALFEQVHSVTDGAPGYSTGYARALLRMGRLDRALEIAGRNAIDHPDHPDHSFRLAEILAALGDWDAAVAHISVARTLDPGNATYGRKQRQWRRAALRRRLRSLLPPWRGRVSRPDARP